MKTTVASLLFLSLFLASCSTDSDILNQDPSSFVDKKIESPFFGNKNAKVQMQIFTDFQCPACIQFQEIIGGQLFSEYVDKGKIGLEYRMFPLPIHKNAPEDALAALCAESQGRFKEFSNEMYGLEEQKKWGEIVSEEREGIAKKIGLDAAAFQKCVKERNYVSKIKEDMALGNELWLRGTPSVYINGKIINFKSREGLFNIIDALSGTDMPVGKPAPENK